MKSSKLALLLNAAIGLTVSLLSLSLGAATFNPVILSALLILAVSGVRIALLWGMVGALIFETASPFPPLTFVLALILTILIMHLIMLQFITHRTALGTAFVGALGIMFHELFLLVLSRTGKVITVGWTPIIDQSYFTFLVSRVIFGTIIVACVFLIVQYFSPRVRGVIIRS